MHRWRDVERGDEHALYIAVTIEVRKVVHDVARLFCGGINRPRGRRGGRRIPFAGFDDAFQVTAELWIARRYILRTPADDLFGRGAEAGRLDVVAKSKDKVGVDVGEASREGVG